MRHGLATPFPLADHPLLRLNRSTTPWISGLLEPHRYQSKASTQLLSEERKHLAMLSRTAHGPLEQWRKLEKALIAIGVPHLLRHFVTLPWCTTARFQMFHTSSAPLPRLLRS
jgi:hypothetical protein